MPLTYSAAKIHEREGNLRGPRTCWRKWGSASACTTSRARCPADSNSAWPSPGRWSTVRRSCLPTSRPETSTRAPAKRSCGCSRMLNASGITIILVTHDLAVAQHAQRIIRIRDGRIEDDGDCGRRERPRLDRRADWLPKIGQRNLPGSDGTARDRVRSGGRRHSPARWRLNRRPPS